MQDSQTVIQPRANRIVGIWQKPLVQAFINDPVTLISGAFLAIVLVAVLFAPWVSPHKYQEQQIDLRHLPPLSSGEAIVKDTDDRGVSEDRYYLLGTDHLGRDYLSRLIYGGRISISVGVLGVLTSGIIGIFLGLVAGFYRGFLDDVIMRAVDVFMSVPLLLLALMVLFILGPSFTNIIIVMVVETILVAEGAADRQAVGFGKSRNIGHRFGRPGAPTQHHDRPFSRHQHRAQLLHIARAGMGLHGPIGSRIANAGQFP